MFEELNNIKIYHIIHVDRFETILSDVFLYSDVYMSQRPNAGTTIGMQGIKERRLHHYLSSLPDLTVGQCVPFYFCPRSIMLYVIHCKNNPDLAYLNGQDDILHLVFSLGKVLSWANDNSLKTCYTTSNAGSSYFEDFNDFSKIIENIDWESVKAKQWSGNGINPNVKENKQAEFLIESRLSIELLETVGVYNLQNYQKVSTILNKYQNSAHLIQRSDWYY